MSESSRAYDIETSYASGSAKCVSLMARDTLLFAILCAAVVPQSAHAQYPTAQILQYETRLTEFIEQGRYLDAEKVGLEMKAFAIHEFGQGSDMNAAALTDLSAVYSGWGRYEDAEQSSLSSIAIWEKLHGPDNFVLGDALNNLATCYLHQHRFGDAARTHRRALAVRTSKYGAQSSQAAMSLENLALTYDRMGHYPEAEDLYRLALAIHLKIHGLQHRTVAVNLMNTGLMYKRQGRIDLAETYLRDSLQLRKFIANPSSVGVALENLGQICAHSRRFAEAEKYCLEARETYVQVFGKDHPIVDTLIGLADVYYAQDRYREAEELYQRALVAGEKLHGVQSADVSTYLSALGALYMAQSRFAEAEDYFDRALKIAKVTGLTSTELAEKRYLRGIAAWNAGHKAKGLDDFVAGMRLTEEIRSALTGADHQRSEAFGNTRDRFFIPAHYLFVDGNYSQGFNCLERGRGRTLLEQMAAAHVDLLAGMPDDQAQALRANEQAAQTQIASLDRQLEVVSSRADLNDAHREEEKQRLMEKLASARRQAVESYAAIRTASPRYRNIVGQEAKPIELEQLQSWLAEREALLLYFSTTKYGLHVFCVGGQNRQPRDVKITVSQEQSKLLGLEAGSIVPHHLHAMLINEGGGGIVQLLSRLPASDSKDKPAAEGNSQMTAKLHALWEFLVPEAERKMVLAGDFKRLVIIPDGPLALLPFEALVTSDGEKTQYLLDAPTAIDYAPSATILCQLANRTLTPTPEKREPVLTVGDPIYAAPVVKTGAARAGHTSLLHARYGGLGGPLNRIPFSGTESKWVAETFRKNDIASVSLKREQATERAVRSGMAGRQVVHLACHGLADDSYANFFGALALTPGASQQLDLADDGFLSLTEIYNLDLASCELAILSACSTNYGPQSDGEGVWGLSRGFLVAGARRVVASNWRVDDEAAASQVSYYCSLLAKHQHDGQTLDYAQSLRNAKRWTRGQPKWKHPYFWATFVLIGPN